jgi:hypothetical protein
MTLAELQSVELSSEKVKNLLYRSPEGEVWCVLSLARCQRVALNASGLSVRSAAPPSDIYRLVANSANYVSLTPLDKLNSTTLDIWG